MISRIIITKIIDYYCTGPYFIVWSTNADDTRTDAWIISTVLVFWYGTLNAIYTILLKKYLKTFFFSKKNPLGHPLHQWWQPPQVGRGDVLRVLIVLILTAATATYSYVYMYLYDVPRYINVRTYAGRATHRRITSDVNHLCSYIPLLETCKSVAAPHRAFLAHYWWGPDGQCRACVGSAEGALHVRGRRTININNNNISS